MRNYMHLKASGLIFRYASKLRQNETPAEKLLWEKIKDRQIEGEKFRRQHPLKKFALDFYCYRLRLGIELDGKQHLIPEIKFYDQDRSEILEEYGIYILRFTNQEVFNDMDRVIETIRLCILDLKSKRLLQ